MLSGVLRVALLDVLGSSSTAPDAGATAAAGARSPWAGSWSSRTTRSTRWWPPACSRHSATPPDRRGRSGAVDAVREGGFDAVLMDVQMPRMDGYAATRRIRAAETGSRLPVIAMTAAAVEGEWERCLAAGMDDFLTKPVNPARLEAALERWLASAPGYAERLDLARLAELRELDNPGEGRSYVNRAIGNLLAAVPGDLATMRAAADDGDGARLRAAAHRLAGAALNLGAVALGEGARGIEELAADGALAAASAALSELGAELEADLQALAAYQREQFPARAGWDDRPRSARGREPIWVSTIDPGGKSGLSCSRHAGQPVVRGDDSTRPHDRPAGCGVCRHAVGALRPGAARRVPGRGRPGVGPVGPSLRAARLHHGQGGRAAR